MYLANTAIKRPVFTVMVISALVVLGISSFLQMNTELNPDVEFPFVIISTVYPGAGPTSVETDVTNKIEDAVNTIAGIKEIQSYSRESYSLVFIQFTLETKADVAAQDVRDKMAGISDDLPSDIEAPVIQKFDFAAMPVVTLSIASERSQKEITSFAKNFLKRRLETVSGVGSVEIVGGSEREIQALLDLDKINALGITPDEITGAVQSSNLELPAGNLSRGPHDLSVRTVGRVATVDELAQVIVHNSEGKIIRLTDIADVKDGVKEKESLSRFNGNESVTLSLVKQSGANIVKVANGIIKRLDEIHDEIPSDIKVTIVSDDSQFIKDSIHDMIFDLLYGGLLAVLVIFLFLANLRSTIISGLAIPTSIVATFFIMKLFGFTINMMTLLALSLSVGLLIDDAIVVIENIYRHLDAGESPIQAARNATQEIGLAVMATTFSIVVVFLPVAFMSGIVGRFFYQFGITVAAAVVISLFVAFTLTPMLSSRFLKKEEQLGKSRPGIINIPGNIIRWILRTWNGLFDKLNIRYKSTLSWVLRHRFITLALASIVFFASLLLPMSGYLGSEFMPQSDQGQFLVIFKSGPDVSLERTGVLAKKIEDKIAKYPEIKFMLTTIGGTQTPVNEGQVFVKLKPMSERERSSFQLITQAREDLADIAGLTIRVQAQAGEAGGNQDVEYSVRGPDLNEVKILAAQVEGYMRAAKGAIDIENSEKLARPEAQIDVKRDLANDLGISIAGVATTVRNLIDGVVVSRFKEKDEEYDIRLRLAKAFRRNIEDLEQIKIKSTKKVRDEDLIVNLGHVANFTMASGPTEIRRYNRQREVRVGCNIMEGYASSDVVNYVSKALKDMVIPAGYKVSVVGTAEIQEESFANIFMSLILAVLFIYLLLASQFESFIDPLVIMLSLPLAIVGALLTLFIWNSTINIVSLIGIVMLMGLVTKNAILLIDFIKQQRRNGVERFQAILIAGPIRLRPILMTTFSTIFGMLPVALGLGESAGFKASMGRAVIGGLISSTVLTLVIIPVVYTLFDDIVAFVLGHETVRVEADSIDDSGDTKSE